MYSSFTTYELQSTDNNNWANWFGKNLSLKATDLVRTSDIKALKWDNLYIDNLTAYVNTIVNRFLTAIYKFFGFESRPNKLKMNFPLSKHEKKIFLTTIWSYIKYCLRQRNRFFCTKNRLINSREFDKAVEPWQVLVSWKITSFSFK